MNNILLLSRTQVSISPTGEMLVYAAGEIHLQKCLNELTTRIAPHIDLEKSDPIVPFRETVLHRALCNTALFDSIRSLSQELRMLADSSILPNTTFDTEFSAQQGINESIVVYIRPPQKTGTKLCCRISVHSLPACLVDWVDKNTAALAVLQAALKSGNKLSVIDWWAP